MLYGSLRSLDIKARMAGRYCFSSECEYWIYRSSEGREERAPDGMLAWESDAVMA